MLSFDLIERYKLEVNLKLGSLIKETRILLIQRCLFPVSSLLDLLNVEVLRACRCVLVKLFEIVEQFFDLLLPSRNDFVSHLAINIDGNSAYILLILSIGLVLLSLIAIKLLLVLFLDKLIFLSPTTALAHLIDLFVENLAHSLSMVTADPTLKQRV